MAYEFVTLDVFTDQTFGGNPLAVLPDARGLSPEQMQAIAREFNHSETTFVLPPESEDNTRRVRIFTTMSEIPFAGHPNVGTAVDGAPMIWIKQDWLDKFGLKAPETLDDAIELAARMGGIEGEPRVQDPVRRERLTLWDLLTGTASELLRPEASSVGAHYIYRPSK